MAITNSTATDIIDAGATGVTLVQSATEAAGADAIGLGTGDSPTFTAVSVGTGTVTGGTFENTAGVTTVGDAANGITVPGAATFSSTLKGTTAGSYNLKNGVSSVFNPTINPHNSYLSAGLGGDANNLSLISGGQEIARAAYLTGFCVYKSLIGSLPIRPGTYTFATTPTASSYTGYTITISDRASKHAYSDGTNWRFVVDGVIIS